MIEVSVLFRYFLQVQNTADLRKISLIKSSLLLQADIQCPDILWTTDQSNGKLTVIVYQR